MSSFFESAIKLSIFGQSHSPAIGMTLDGIPAGEEINMEELSAFLERRAPGRQNWSTPRKETDKPEFLSGLLDNHTCGVPITAIIRNENFKKSDYNADVPRPGHADYTAQMKYKGFQDPSGGGHFSGRLTAALCIAGGICIQLLKRRGIFIAAHIASIADVQDIPFDPIHTRAEMLETLTKSAFPVQDPDVGIKMRQIIEEARCDLDSVGGIVECLIVGVPVGLGEPMFEGMENQIARLVFAIPAVKGIEFGNGFAAATLRGSENNDAFVFDGDTVRTKTNRHGGILGGITSGMPIVFRAVVKPTPSIARMQESVSFSGKETVNLEIHGRHDPCIVPRAVPCFEAAAAIAVYDALMKV
ncbi:MAG: chorismate synthase [Evtepia sp.]